MYVKFCVIANEAKQSGFAEEYPDASLWKARLLHFVRNDKHYAHNDMGEAFLREDLKVRGWRKRVSFSGAG